MANIVVGLAASATTLPLPLTKATTFTFTLKSQKLYLNCSKTRNRSLSSISSSLRNKGSCSVFACLPHASESSSTSSPTRLYVSGISFRTTEETLRNVFKNFGQLVEVNMVMDKIANRPRGFAFLRYATEQESQKAIEGMHGKFLDGRVIFVEIAKPRADLRQRSKQNTVQ